MGGDAKTYFMTFLKLFYCLKEYMWLTDAHEDENHPTNVKFSKIAYLSKACKNNGF